MIGMAHPLPWCPICQGAGDWYLWMPLSEPLNKVGKLDIVYKVTWNLKQEIIYLELQRVRLQWRKHMLIMLKALSLISSTSKREREKGDDLLWKAA